MADKAFGVKDINLIGASGTPTIESPNNLNINAVNVAISTDITVAGKVSLGAGTSISSPAANTLTLGTNSVERVRLTSDGRIGIATDNPNSLGRVSIVVPSTGGHGAINIQNHEVGAGKTNIVFRSLDNNGGNWADAELRAEAYSFKIRTTERFRIDSGGNIGIGTDNPTELVTVGAAITTALLEIKPQLGAFDINVSSGDFAPHYQDNFVIYKGQPGAGTERFRVDSAGTIKCGTSATLKAEINSAIGGHQFISQCDDNNNGFEIYQQHGSTTTRNTFAVYANTGGGGAQELQFSVRGDGCVTKPKSPAFSANLSGGNLNLATHNNIIIFNNQHFDRSDSYDTSNGRFTAPVAGLYYFGVQLYAGFSMSGVRVLHAAFRKNGSVVGTADMFGGASDHGGTSYHPTGCGHIFLDLAVNDYVQFHSGSFSSSGSGNALLYADTGTRFFGYLVG